MVKKHGLLKIFNMAGKNISFFVVGIAMFSSTMSGFGFVGGPGLVYSMGVSSFWMIVATGMGITISAFLLGKRLWLIGRVCKAASLPDVLAARYNSESVRFSTAMAILAGVLGYLATQMLAMANVLWVFIEGD